MVDEALIRGATISATEMFKKSTGEQKVSED